MTNKAIHNIGSHLPRKLWLVLAQSAFVPTHTGEIIEIQCTVFHHSYLASDLSLVSLSVTQSGITDNVHLTLNQSDLHIVSGLEQEGLSIKLVNDVYNSALELTSTIFPCNAYLTSNYHTEHLIFIHLSLSTEGNIYPKNYLY